MLCSYGTIGINSLHCKSRPKHNAMNTLHESDGRGIRQNPKSFSHRCVKSARLNGGAMLHLDKDAVTSGRRKTVREFDGTRHRVVMLAVFFAVLGGRTDPGSITHAFSVTLFGIAGCHLLGAALGAGLGQPRRRRRQPAEVLARSCPAPAE